MTTPIAAIKETSNIRKCRFTGKCSSDVPTDGERNDGQLERLLDSALEIASHEGSNRLTEDDRAHLTSVLGHEVSENTKKNYNSQWRRFTAWAGERSIRTLPAGPLQVAAYLAERMEKHGHRPATLQTAAAAIGFVHRAEGLPDPCESAEVRNTLRSARRKAGMEQRQAEGLTDEALHAIVSTACLPRRWRGGRTESPEAAERRGVLDIAIVRVMRDALLRVSEAAELLWEDIEEEEDGTGRLLIRRSKTDADGEGTIAFLSAPTMEDLEAIRAGASPEDNVFGLRPNRIARRIKEAARAAGLGEGFSGHSPRVGMARDLARSGTELTRLMTAGRWRSPRMPALYTRNETVARGAVAQFYGSHGRNFERKGESGGSTKVTEEHSNGGRNHDGHGGCSTSGSCGRMPRQVQSTDAGQSRQENVLTRIRALIQHASWCTRRVRGILPNSLAFPAPAKCAHRLSPSCIT